MNASGWGEILVTIGITVALAIPLGAYLARVWQGERTWLDPVLKPVEGALYWTFGVDAKKSQTPAHSNATAIHTVRRWAKLNDHARTKEPARARFRSSNQSSVKPTAADATGPVNQ